MDKETVKRKLEEAIILVAELNVAPDACLRTNPRVWAEIVKEVFKVLCDEYPKFLDEDYFKKGEEPAPDLNE